MLGRILAPAGAAALCLMLSGCFASGGSWSIPSFMTPPRNAYEGHPYTPPQESRPQGAGATLSSRPPREEEEHGASAQPPSSRPAPPEASAPAPAAPTPQPSVTLADGGASRDRALRLLDGAGARLAKVDRAKLSNESATTYDQASDFLRAGRKAASEQDYVAASGYAQKASVLASKLTPTSP